MEIQRISDSSQGRININIYIHHRTGNPITLELGYGDYSLSVWQLRCWPISA
jgi:hypothetical protein